MYQLVTYNYIPFAFMNDYKCVKIAVSVTRLEAIRILHSINDFMPCPTTKENPQHP